MIFPRCAQDLRNRYYSAKRRENNRKRSPSTHVSAGQVCAPEVKRYKISDVKPAVEAESATIMPARPVVMTLQEPVAVSSNHVQVGDELDPLFDSLAAADLMMFLGISSDPTLDFSVKDGGNAFDFPKSSFEGGQYAGDICFPRLIA